MELAIGSSDCGIPALCNFRVGASMFSVYVAAILAWDDTANVLGRKKVMMRKGGCGNDLYVLAIIRHERELTSLEG